MSTLSQGEKWIQLIRAYGPVAENDAMHAEHVDALALTLGVKKIDFEHPARATLLACFPTDSGEFRNVVLTGIAGEGKTTLCFELVQALTGKSALAHDGIESFDVTTAKGSRKVTLIYDVTAWRKRTGGHLSPDHVSVLERMALSCSTHGTSEYFVLAVNDGQIHELFRALPPDAPSTVRTLERRVIEGHSRGDADLGERLRLINLSSVRSALIMELCLKAVLDRPEWSCFQSEPDNPIFSESSSLRRNYRCLNTPTVRAKLITLAQIADTTGNHLPIRGVLCMLANALLGHPDAKDRVIRPGTEAATLCAAGKAPQAALHRTLFGQNLTNSNRRKRSVYSFLSMLQIGEETTNDLDELLIFGSRDPELKGSYSELVEPDQHLQRNPDFAEHVRRYIKGDLTEDESISEFMDELAAERRRIFLHASPELFNKYRLWETTIFHHAREYLADLVAPLDQKRRPSRSILRRVASGLNRVWTGLLLGELATEIHIATGLDQTTSPVGDIHITRLEIESDPPGIDFCKPDGLHTPQIVLASNGRKFSFELTLQRFEFLYRVAEGAMPTSFSREACADFMSLKQRCLRDLELRMSDRILYLIEVGSSGNVQRAAIHLHDE